MTAALHSARGALADALAAVVSYLPVMLMGLLALATWWLVRSTPVPADPRPPGPPRGEPDYTMERFVVQRFDAQGTLRTRIEGDHVRHYPDADRLEIDGPRVHSVDPDGRVTVAQARRAVSNGDGSEIVLTGEARVRREGLGEEPAVAFEGESLRASRLEDRLVADRPVKITRGESVMRADRAVYDQRARVLTLQGQVRVTLVPTPARSSPAPAAPAARSPGPSPAARPS